MNSSYFYKALQRMYLVAQAANLEQRPLFLYGAGKHTDFVQAQTTILDQFQWAGILDDNTENASCCNIKIVPRETLEDAERPLVIISSTINQNSLRDRLSRLENVETVCLYPDDQLDAAARLVPSFPTWLNSLEFKNLRKHHESVLYEKIISGASSHECQSYIGENLYFLRNIKGVFSQVARELYADPDVSTQNLLDLTSWDGELGKLDETDKLLHAELCYKVALSKKLSSYAPPAVPEAEKSKSAPAGHLGISLTGHAPGIAVVDDQGVPSCIYEESKFNGFKVFYDHIPFSLKQLKQDGFASFKSVTWSFYENHVERFNRFPKDAFLDRDIPELGKLKTLLQRDLSWENEYLLGHHDAHIQSAFRASGMDKALIISADGDGGKYSVVVALADQNSDPEVVTVATCPSSFSYGDLYGAITAYLGYRHGHYLTHAGKIMGLSSYGKPRYLDKLLSAFPVAPGEPFSTASSRIIDWEDFFQVPCFPKLGDKFSQLQADVAASLQAYLENDFMRMLKFFKALYPAYENLCFAGGVALNSLMNGLIVKSSLFQNVFIQPQASDCGIALGAALYGASQNRKGTAYRWQHAYYGHQEKPEDGHRGRSDLLDLYGFPLLQESPSNPVKKAVELLLDKQIIGLFQGRQEVGPRALGNRSILTLPTEENRDKVNAKVKFREGWRPFAPIVLEEYVEEYFCNPRPEPFMTIIYDVREKYRDVLGGITHVDGTARLQTINKEQNSFVHDVLAELAEHDLPPVLLNTSFNINGQPIIRTYYDAIVTFLCSGIDYLLLQDDCLLSKESEDWPAANVHPADRSIEPFLRRHNSLSIAMFPTNRDTLEQLEKVLAFPSVALRVKNGSLSLDALFVRTNRSSCMELRNRYRQRFKQVINNSLSGMTEDTMLLTITGGNRLLSSKINDFRLCAGFEETPAAERNPGFVKDLMQQLASVQGPDRVLTLDHYWRLLPYDYLISVV